MEIQNRRISYITRNKHFTVKGVEDSDLFRKSKLEQLKFDFSISEETFIQQLSGVHNIHFLAILDYWVFKNRRFQYANLFYFSTTLLECKEEKVEHSIRIHFL